MKRRLPAFSGFLTSFLLTSFWHLKWTVPAWVLLGLHIWLRISVWWSLGCFIIFFAIIFIRCIILNSLISAGSFNDAEKPNVNPYSSKLSDILPDKDKNNRERN